MVIHLILYCLMSLFPIPNIQMLRCSDVKCHNAQLQHDTRCHILPELPVGSKVGYRNHVINNFDVGIISARDVRLYTICMENSRHISRNCIDLKWTDAPFEPKSQTKSVSNFAKCKHAPTIVPSSTNANVKHDNKAKLIGKRVEAGKSTSMYTTHSGHISKPATRLITQM